MVFSTVRWLVARRIANSGHKDFYECLVWIIIVHT